MIISVGTHLANDSLCFVLGSLFNLTLLWLVAKHTPKETSQYRPILRLTACIDLVYSAIFVVVVPIIFVESGYIVYLQTGPLRWLPQPYNFVVIAVWLYCLSFSTGSLAVPFVYRYLYICHGKVHYRWPQFSAMLVVPALASAGMIVVMAETGTIPAGETQSRMQKMFFNDTSDWIGDKNHKHYNPHPIAYLRELNRGKATTLYTISAVLTIYTLIFYCGWRIYRHLIRMAQDNLDVNHYRARNLQLSTVLMLQSLVPLLVNFLPTMLLSIANLVGIRPSAIATYASASWAWVPVLNPLIAIWVVKAYRNAVIEWFKRLTRTKVQRTTTIAAQPNVPNLQMA